MPPEPTATKPHPAATTGAAKAFSALIGVASLVVLLQGLWAGLFIHEGQDYKDNWVEVHARGAEVAILVTVIAFVLAAVKFRHRRDLLIGTAALAMLLIIESYLGGEIGDKPDLTAVHIPLGMGLMGLSVWLPLRSRSLR